MTKPKMLWISDAGVDTGFGRVTHNILGWLGAQWDRACIGVNYKGDPHPYPYPIYPAIIGGDMWGFGRLEEVVKKERPDIVLIQSDAWIVETFVKDAAPDVENCPPIVGFMPVDGRGVKRSTAEGLSGLALGIFYTRFGEEQAIEAGFTARSTNIGLGVRRELYKPMDRSAARRRVFPNLPADAFVFGNVNRNQPRKRLDLTVACFAEWLKRSGADNAYLYLHCLREDCGWDIEEVGHYYGIDDQLILTNAKTHEDLLPESLMPLVYSACDVLLSSTLGEGWGLPTLEAMACGTPQIVPDYAALAEWARGAVRYVPVEHEIANFGFRAFGIGAAPVKGAFVDAMDELYRDANARADLAAAGLKKAAEDRFSWAHVAKRFHEELTAVLNERTKAAA